MASLAELGEISKAWTRKPGESDQDFADRKRRNNSALIGAGVGSLVATPLIGGPIGAGIGYYGSKRKAEIRRAGGKAANNERLKRNAMAARERANRK